MPGVAASGWAPGWGVGVGRRVGCGSGAGFGGKGIAGRQLGQRDDRIAIGRVAVGDRPGEVGPPAPDGDRGQGRRHGRPGQEPGRASPASAHLLDYLHRPHPDRDSEGRRKTERSQGVGRSTFRGHERSGKEDGQCQEDQGVARVAAHPPQPHHSKARDHAEWQRHERQPRHVVARVRVAGQAEHRHRPQDVGQRVAVRLHARVEDARRRRAPEVVRRLRHGDGDHRRRDREERRDERDGSGAQLVVAGAVGAAQPPQPDHDQDRQQLERLIRVQRRQRGDRPGERRRRAAGPRGPVQQRDQRHRTKEGHDGVAHAVAIDADEPQRARGPGSGDHSRPRPEASPQGPDPQHARHAECSRGRAQDQDGLPEELERGGDRVGEERLAPAVVGKPDQEVGVEAGLVEKPRRVQPLGRLVAVEAAGVRREIDEAKQDGGRHDRGQRPEREPGVPAPQRGRHRRRGPHQRQPRAASARRRSLRSTWIDSPFSWPLNG